MYLQQLYNMSIGGRRKTSWNWQHTETLKRHYQSHVSVYIEKKTKTLAQRGKKSQNAKVDTQGIRNTSKAIENSIKKPYEGNKRPKKKFW